MTYTPLAFLAQLAPGQTCVGTDRDGEAWLKVLLARADAADVMARLDELQEGFYVTLVPEARVREMTKGSEKRKLRKSHAP
jgi:hypothetical protein